MSEIKTLSPDDARGKARWDAFVLRHPRATFCHRAGWQNVLQEVFRHRTYFLYIERAGEVCAILPLAQVRSRLFGNRVSALPFAVYGGAVADDPEEARRLVMAAQAMAVRLDADHLELRSLQREHPDWPVNDLYVTFRKSIFPDEAANLQQIPRRQRAMVRKGIGNGLVARADTDVHRFFALYADNVHRHGSPALPRRWFEALRREFGRDCRMMTVSSADGTPVSSVMSFHFRDEVLPYYAGDTLAARDLAANDFKYWELMRRACGEGVRMFDFGRSKAHTGAFAYKKNWGFEPAALHYEYALLKRTTVPQNNPANPRYGLPIRVWRKLPLAVATRLGPMLSRSLG
jgi:FemAB-related protein (PEP-CTERM system-associated)